MKLLVKFLLTLIVYNNIYSQDKIEIENFGKNPGNLKMFVYNPTLTGPEKKPLVVVLHGCTQNAKEVAELTGWEKIAKNNNFVLLFPQQKFINNPSSCFNWFRDEDTNKGKGECESIFEMIEHAKIKYNIDSSKIYITGLSAGASMCMALLATHPETFKSAAVFSGGGYKIASGFFESIQAMSGKINYSQTELTKAIKKQNPSYNGTYPTLIIYHGKDDNLVNFKNASTILNQWAGIWNIDTIADKTENPYMGINDICRKEYQDSTSEPKIILYEISNLGHQLLVKPGEQAFEGGKKGKQGVDKGFHSTYQTAKEFGLTP